MVTSQMEEKEQLFMAAFSVSSMSMIAKTAGFDSQICIPKQVFALTSVPCKYLDNENSSPHPRTLKKFWASIEYFYIPGYEKLISAKFIKSFIQKVKHKRPHVISWGLYFYHLQELESHYKNHEPKQDYCSNALPKSPCAYNCIPTVVMQLLVFEGYLALSSVH